MTPSQIRRRLISVRNILADQLAMLNATFGDFEGENLDPVTELLRNLASAEAYAGMSAAGSDEYLRDRALPTPPEKTK